VKIKIGPHILLRAKEHGTNKREIIDVIKTGNKTLAKYNHIANSKVFNFNGKWLGKYYNQKMVKVFYTIKENTIITLTVYVFYGNWK